MLAMYVYITSWYNFKCENDGIWTQKINNKINAFSSQLHGSRYMGVCNSFKLLSKTLQNDEWQWVVHYTFCESENQVGGLDECRVNKTKWKKIVQNYCSYFLSQIVGPLCVSHNASGFKLKWHRHFIVYLNLHLPLCIFSLAAYVWASTIKRFHFMFLLLILNTSLIHIKGSSIEFTIKVMKKRGIKNHSCLYNL